MSAQTKNKEMGKALQFYQELKADWVRSGCIYLLSHLRKIDNEMREREEIELCGMCAKPKVEHELNYIWCWDCRHKKFIYDLLEEENKDNKEINIK